MVLLGSPIEKVTLLHHAEHLAKVPHKRIDRYKMPILQGGKRVWMEFEEYDTTRGIVEWADDYFGTIVQEYLAAGNGWTGKVGAADAYRFEAAALDAFGVAWMEKHFAAPASPLAF